MIDAINSTSLTSASSAASGAVGSDSGGSGTFDAALIAAQRAKQRQQQHDSEMDAIKSKGFTTWARDEQIEALKEKLRQKVLAEMGMDENALTRLSATMRQILEQKIQEEVDRRMQEEMAKQQDDSKDAKTGKDAKDGKSITAATATPTAPSTTTMAAANTTQKPGKKDQDGNCCPVIPALSWPGAASLF